MHTGNGAARAERRRRWKWTYGDAMEAVALCRGNGIPASPRAWLGGWDVATLREGWDVILREWTFTKAPRKPRAIEYQRIPKGMRNGNRYVRP